MKVNYVTKKLTWGLRLNLFEWALVPAYYKDDSSLFSVRTSFKFLFFDIKIVRQKE